MKASISGTFQEIAKAQGYFDNDEAVDSFLAAFDIAKSVYKKDDERLGDLAVLLASAYSKIKTEDGSVYGES